MQAALYESFGGPIQIRTIPVPTIDRSDESHEGAVVIKVMATGICRSDFHGWMGHDSDVRRHGLPFCPGHEVSGVVVETGRRVKRFRTGDRVAVPFILSCGACEPCRHEQSTVCTRQEQPGFTRFGSFAEYVLLPRADRNLCIIPSRVSFVQAAALGCRVSTAYRAVVERAKLLPAESIAVFGAGGVGLACCMIARALECRQIIAVDTNPYALEKAASLGATHTVLATKGADAVRIVTDRVRALTEGREGAHVTVDAAGFRETCEAAVHCTRRGSGRMIQVGLISSSSDNNNDDGDGFTHSMEPPPPIIPMGLVAAHELQILGSHGFDSNALSALLDMVADGRLDPGQLVERHVSLEEGARVLESMKHSSPLGMVMITQFGPPSSGASVVSSRL
jgi:alcohol dehydrogenase